MQEGTSVYLKCHEGIQKVAQYVDFLLINVRDLPRCVRQAALTDRVTQIKRDNASSELRGCNGTCLKE